MLSALQYGAGAVSGVMVGFVLGLVGGGGSVLAVPLLLYFVGLKDPHQAIGTSALGVAANALAGLWSHARAKNVNWRCGGVFAVAGVFGAFGGSTLGKLVDGQKLLFLFALLMLLVSGLMFRNRGAQSDTGAVCNRDNIGKVLSFGFTIGGFSGFFGIGGGFLIVPGLVASTSMPILGAVGTSLVPVAAFGITTAANYATSGLVIWPLAGIFVLGGAAGSLLGTRASRTLDADKGRLSITFACFVALVGLYVLVRSALALHE